MVVATAAAAPLTSAVALGSPAEVCDVVVGRRRVAVVDVDDEEVDEWAPPLPPPRLRRRRRLFVDVTGCIGESSSSMGCCRPRWLSACCWALGSACEAGGMNALLWKENMYDMASPLVVWGVTAPPRPPMRAAVPIDPPFSAADCVDIDAVSKNIGAVVEPVTRSVGGFFGESMPTIKSDV